MLKSWNEVIGDGRAGLYGENWINAAAILIEGKIHWHARHHLIIQDLAEKRLLTKPASKQNLANQGFRLNNGDFIDRVKGLELAKQNGQFAGPDYRTELFSEDLWVFKE